MTATSPPPLTLTPGAHSRRIPELDGLRGIGALMIVAYHFGAITPAPHHPLLRAWNLAIALSWTGVDMFFVLSGCLITGILLETRHSPHRFRTFYARRALRILPLYYAAVAFFFWLYLPVAHLALEHGVYKTGAQSWMQTGMAEQVWYWLHVSNWHTAFGHLEVSPVTQFWSLAIEEQFYFLWPFIVYRFSEKRLLKVCVFAICSCCLLRNLPYFQAQQAQHPGFLYRLTPFRVDILLFGAAIPLLARLPEIRASIVPWLTPALVAAFGGFLTACIWGRSTEMFTGPMTRLGYSSLGLFWFVVVFRVVENTGSSLRLPSLLRGALVTKAGQISYGIYIINLLIASAIAFGFKRLFPSAESTLLRTSLSLIVGLAASWMLAELSWRYLEKPCLKLKRYFAY